MKEETLDVEKLAELISAKVSRKPEPLLVDIHGLEDLLCTGFNSSITRRLIKAEDFPSSMSLADSNKRFWRVADVKAYIDKKLEEQSKAALCASV
jgi:predicted DNA-binding transcriptional regulator AlpA